MTAAPALATLVNSARRRAAANLVSEHVCVGLIAALGGLILLLIMGTQVLDWYWLAVLFLGATGIAAWRTWRTLPSAYGVAQMVDHRLGLHDALSTAFHFQQPGASDRASAAIVDAQTSAADRTASGIVLSEAMPWRTPRQVYWAIGLAAVAGGMLVLRYGILGSLDLRRPMVEAVADFFQPTKEIAARGKRPPEARGDQPFTVPTEGLEQLKKEDLDAAPDEALAVTDTPDVNAGTDSRDAMKSKQSEVKAAGDEPGDDLEAGDDKSDRPGEGGKDDNGEGKGGSPDASKQGPQNAKQNEGGDQQNSSLMDKMRDAMANLMNKMKIPNQGQQQSQRASNQKGQEKGSAEQSGAGQKGEKGQGQQQGKGTPSDDPDADAQKGEQQAQSGQGKSNDKSADSGAPTDAKSGMGKQDGSKDIKDAEALAALGKLSEIFGKRAQNVTGEVMIEVQSGKAQQLRTAYSQRNAAHKEAGGEIHRDEVGIDDQQYVRKYFEQVRAGEPAAGAQPAPSAPATPPAK